MIKSIITDGNGRGDAANIEDNALMVTQYTCPPMIPQKNKVFSQKFTDDGLSSGSNDLGIDGSATAVDYWIPSSEDSDRYIVTLSLIMGYGTTAEGYEFADSGAPLTNGVKIAYHDTNGIETMIMNPKANYSFMRTSFMPLSYTAWQDRGFAATGDYGYIVTIPLDRIMPPYGIKLDMGTKQKIIITIRDDCTDADLFNCTGFGFDRFE